MSKISAKSGFMLYKNYWDTLHKWNDNKLGKLFRAIYEYQIEGKESVDPDIETGFDFIVSYFKVDNEKYQERCEQNKKNSLKYHNNKEAYDQIRSISTDPDKDNDKENDKGFALNMGQSEIKIN